MATVYADKEVLDYIAKQFIEAGVPSAQHEDQRMRGYFRAEDLAKLIGAEHPASVREMFRFLNQESDKSPPMYSTETFDFPDNIKVRCSYISRSKTHVNFRVHIPEGDTQALNDIARLVHAFDRTNKQADRERADLEAASERVPNARPKNKWFAATYLFHHMIERYREPFKAMMGLWGARLLDSGYPFEQDMSLTDGTALKAAMMKYEKKTQPCIYWDGGEDNLGGLYLKLYREIETWEQAAAAKAGRASDTGQWLDNMGLREKLKDFIKGGGFDGGEFNMMWRVFRETSLGRTGVLRLPGDNGAQIKIRMRGDQFELLIPEGQEEATFKALEDYMYGIDDSTPRPTRDGSAEPPPPAGGSSSKPPPPRRR